MNVSSVLRATGLTASGFAATAVLAVAYGFLLVSVWESVFDAPWPGLGNNPAESMFRARVIDTSFGLAAGVLMAVVASLFCRGPGQRGMIWVFLGAVAYSAMTAWDSQRALTAFLESPSPALLAGFSIAAFLAKKRDQKAHV